MDTKKKDKKINKQATPMVIFFSVMVSVDRKR